LNSRSTFTGQRRTGTRIPLVIIQGLIAGTQRASDLTSNWALVRVIQHKQTAVFARETAHTGGDMHVIITAALATFGLISVVALSAQIWDYINTDQDK